MVLSMIVPQSDDDLIDPTFASRYVNVPLARFKLPETSIPKEAAYQIISDELTLDGRPRLNLASTISTWMEPECDKLISEAINKNFANMDEYPVTAELQNRCVNIIARLFNAPCGKNDTAFGVATIGSSEAAMLAGLAYKYKWQQKRKDEGKPYGQPNFVAGANVHVCWKKFALYFDVEFREVKLSEGYYVMDPQKAVEMVDENTIFVTAIFGSTLTGEFENVKDLNELLAEKNNQQGWDIPIHVDAASGGFVAPFLYPDIEWDFRLPLVNSINVSGHKYGLVYAGIGWAIWRSKKDLPDDLFFDVSYLGGDQPTFTFNFTKGACQVLAQYYQLIRLGHQGYNKIMNNCRENAMILKDAIEKIGYFNILSKDVGVPVVTISLKDRSKFNEFDVSKVLRQYGWIVEALNMPKDVDNVTVIRVAVREDFSRNQVVHFVEDIRKVLEGLNPSKASSRDGTVAVNKSTATNGVC